MEFLGLHIAIWFVLIVYFCGMLLLGWWSKRSVRDHEGYLLGNRQFGTGMMIMHSFGAGTHPGAPASVISRTVSSGASGIWISWMWMFGTPFYWLIAPLIRRMRYLTMADYFENRFSRSASILYIVIATVGMVVFLASVLLATTRTVQGMMGKSSLPDSSVVRQVITGSEGVLQSKGLPDYCIDTTTGDPDEIVEIAEKCAKVGMSFLDAGISGSSRQIAERKGVFMVGGEQEAFKACEHILNIFSDKIFYLGPSGSGSRAKLASNLILGLNRLVLAEGLVFAEKSGLETGAFLELLKNSHAYSAAMDSKGEKMIRGDFKPESRVRQHYKDVELILKYARKAGQDLPLSEIHLDIMEKAITAGDGDLDNAAVIRELRRRCGDETD